MWQGCDERYAKKAISIGGGFHHAGKYYGGGFCIFNDVVATEWVKVKMNVKRVW